MSRYGDPAALRQALLKRLANQAADLGLPPERLQRRATFERLLVRLEHARPGRFVLKGGMALDVRLAFAGMPVADVEAVDFAQHFAEKLHAYTRRYGDRENSRAKDLVDMAILIEERTDPGAALAAARHVFAVRGLHVLPSELPDPPAFWREDYARLVQDLDMSARTVDDAMRVVRAFWAQALTTQEGD